MRTWHTKLFVSGVAMPDGATIGITESHEEVDGIEKKRDVNGGRCVLKPLWGPKYKISLSASGPAIRGAPALFKLPKDRVVELHPTMTEDDQILAGQPSTTLARPPVPGSIRVFKATDEFQRPVPFTVTGGRLVSVGAPAAEDLVVRYQPILFVSRDSATKTGPEIEGRVEWQAVFEEE